MIEYAVTGKCNGIGEKDTCVLSRRSLILMGRPGKVLDSPRPVE
jgi:hypothetical protein